LESKEVIKELARRPELHGRVSELGTDFLIVSEPQPTFEVYGGISAWLV